MKNERPETTLFMLMSVDGKINSGDSDALDVDRDWKQIAGVKEGIHQYYELEQKTDLVSFNTGRVMAKIGVNDRTTAPNKMPVRFVVVDNQPHLTENGIAYLSQWVEHVYLVTTNKAHPALAMGNLGNVTVILSEGELNFSELFARLKNEFGVERMTIQSGGTMNAALLREGLVDHVSLVVAPLFVGGSTTPTIVDGEAAHSVADLARLKPLKLVASDVLNDSYLHLRYDVLNEV
ncbi:deaminase [bacterium]|nr:deaminase [bacterium]